VTYHPAQSSIGREVPPSFSVGRREGRMKALVIAGARPNFMEVAPILFALREAGGQGVFAHTGQYCEASVSEIFVQGLGLPKLDYHLGVGSGSHDDDAKPVIEAFEPALLENGELPASVRRPKQRANSMRSLGGARHCSLAVPSA
jgi:hypothetical protein